MIARAKGARFIPSSQLYWINSCTLILCICSKADLERAKQYSEISFVRCQLHSSLCVFLPPCYSHRLVSLLIHSNYSNGIISSWVHGSPFPVRQSICLGSTSAARHRALF